MNKRYFIMNNRKVENVVVFDPTLPEDNGWIEAPVDRPEIGIGWRLRQDGTWAPPLAVPPPVPAEVSKLEFRRGLRALGKLDEFSTAATAHSPEFAEEWQYGMTVGRADTVMNEIATSLAITSAELDTIFRRG